MQILFIAVVKLIANNMGSSVRPKKPGPKGPRPGMWGTWNRDSEPIQPDKGSGKLTTTDMGRKLGGGLCPFGDGEMGPHLTQCGLGRGLPPYRVTS